LKQEDFCLFQKWAAAGRLQTGFLHLTYATSKPLISWVKKTVAKLTICATGGKNRRRLDHIVLSKLYNGMPHLTKAEEAFSVNRWNIPDWLESVVLARDKSCVYCGISFVQPLATRGARPSWEHIVNDASIITIENISRCCMSCNASKGAKELGTWLQSEYCVRKGINERTVAQVVRDALDNLRS
jgi:hypothetical protein